MNDMHAVGDHQDGDRQHQGGQDDLSHQDHATSIESIGQYTAER